MKKLLILFLLIGAVLSTKAQNKLVFRATHAIIQSSPDKITLDDAFIVISDNTVNVLMPEVDWTESYDVISNEREYVDGVTHLMMNVSDSESIMFSIASGTGMMTITFINPKTYIIFIVKQVTSNQKQI